MMNTKMLIKNLHDAHCGIVSRGPCGYGVVNVNAEEIEFTLAAIKAAMARKKKNAVLKDGTGHDPGYDVQQFHDCVDECDKAEAEFAKLVEEVK